MNSFTDLSLACLSLADDLYKGDDIAHSLQLLREVCRRDPHIANALNALTRTPLPDFRQTEVLYPAIFHALDGTTIENNPNWLMLNLFLADNAEALIQNFPNKMLLIRGITNFARSLKERYHSTPIYEY